MDSFPFQRISWDAEVGCSLPNSKFIIQHVIHHDSSIGSSACNVSQREQPYVAHVLRAHAQRRTYAAQPHRIDSGLSNPRRWMPAGQPAIACASTCLSLLGVNRVSLDCICSSLHRTPLILLIIVPVVSPFILHLA